MSTYPPSVRRPARAFVAVLAAAALTVSGMALASTANADPVPSSGLPAVVDFGPNVKIFDPSMPQSQIQATVDAIAAQQVDNEMGTARFALLFKPGTYGTAAKPLVFQVGYYTEVAGLGVSPRDVTINGHVDVYNRCFAADNCIALNNFWRSVSNLTINVTGLDGCRSSGNFWAVSQAAPMRRVNITGGNLTLMDYCTAPPQYASGGFMADSKAGTIVNGSQQQFLVRDSSVGFLIFGPHTRRGHRRAGAVLPDAHLHDACDDPGEPREAVPLLGRDHEPLQRVRSGRAHRLVRNDLGARCDRRSRHSPV